VKWGAAAGVEVRERVLRRWLAEALALDEFETQLYTWLAQIPVGRVVTYGQLARLIGGPNGAGG